MEKRKSGRVPRPSEWARIWKVALMNSPFGPNPINHKYRMNIANHLITYINSHIPSIYQTPDQLYSNTIIYWLQNKVVLHWDSDLFRIDHLLLIGRRFLWLKCQWGSYIKKVTLIKPMLNTKHIILHHFHHSSFLPQYYPATLKIRIISL